MEKRPWIMERRTWAMEMRGLDDGLLAPQVSAPLNLLAPVSPAVGLLLAFCVDGVTNHLLGFY